MALLTWDKPKKLRSTVEHNAMHQADCVADGTYVSNMSEEDRLKWKAKKVGGKDPRIEIRKTTRGRLVETPAGDGFFRNRWEGAAQAALVFRPDGTVTISANGKAEFDVGELEQVILECNVAMSVLGD